MGRARSIFLTIALLLALPASGGETFPVMNWAGTPPSGACKGQRVVLTIDGTIYVCPSTTWSPVSGGGGAPTNSTYITQVPDAGLSAEQALSALGTGLMFSTTATGVVTTKPPTNDTVLVGNNTGTDWEALTIPACVNAPNDRALGYNATTNAFSCNTSLRAAELGASDPTNCAAGEYSQGISQTGQAQGCAVPPGTYTLPDATAGVTGGLRLTGDLGGTATSPSVVDDSHNHTTTTISGLDAGADFTAGTLPVARGGTNLGSAAIDTVLLANPANTWTAAAVGSCSTGTSALTYNTTTHVFGCNSIAGGGAPTTALYWTGAADGTLSAEKDLSALSTGLVLNTAGVPSTKAANTCTNQFARSDTASGVWTCAGAGVADFTANQGTVTQVLHGNAAGQPAWGAIVTADLPTVAVSKGGSGLTTVAADQVYVGTAADTFTAKGIPACANATTSKLLYDTATHAWSCGTDQNAGGTMTRLTATWASSATANTLGIVGTGGVPMTSPTYAAAGVASFRCVMSVTRQATTNGPRYGLTTSGTITRASWVSHRGLLATTQTVAQVIVAPTTGTCTTGCDAALGTTVAQVMTDIIEGTVVMNATGTLSLQMAPQAAAALTAQIGSYCIWY
jgi:hypothetical protein